MLLSLVKGGKLLVSIKLKGNGFALSTLNPARLTWEISFGALPVFHVPYFLTLLFIKLITKYNI